MGQHSALKPPCPLAARFLSMQLLLLLLPSTGVGRQLSPVSPQFPLNFSNSQSKSWYATFVFVFFEITGTFKSLDGFCY